AALEGEGGPGRGVRDRAALVAVRGRADEPRDEVVGRPVDGADEVVQRVEADLVVARQDGRQRHRQTVELEGRPGDGEVQRRGRGGRRGGEGAVEAPALPAAAEHEALPLEVDEVVAAEAERELPAGAGGEGGARRDGQEAAVAADRDLD